MNAQERYQLWLNSPDIDETTKEELRAIANDPQEIEERFYTELEFGTAGLRGILGAGDNRMNIYNVRRATEGLARYLDKTAGDHRAVAIAYDSRHYSDVFAKETACVLAAHGIQVYLYESLRAVPQLSFTVRELGLSAGVVITASHNPPKYNGYKVYGASAGQSGPEEAAAITKEIRGVEGFKTAYMDFQEAIDAEKIILIGKQIDEIYYAKTMSLLTQPELVKEHGKDLKLVYTPLHGAGNIPVRTILSRIGIPNVAVVPEQEKPDGSFPTVTAPNPEDPNAFTLAFKLAEQTGASVILATDPDSDRLGVAVKKNDGNWQVLTGNQIGSILIHALLTSYQKMGKLPANGLVVRSIVSTQLADAICKRFGVEIKEVLTGFRFIAEQIAEAERTGEHTFLFGFEESYGFLAGGFARDKDAICASMLVAQACVAYQQRGMTLADALEEVYAIYGFYRERVKSYTLEGKAGIEKIQNAMKRLRQEPLTVIAGRKVVKVDDFTKPEETGLPSSNVLRYTLEDETWVTVRPSGTEPKLKLYLGAHAENEEKCDAILADVIGDVDAKLSGWLA
ncbi:MAG: phospho-sugar mutase [Clostridia bacterium]|nr:phospho-sugar mutase [Clostridia bacterium]